MINKEIKEMCIMTIVIIQIKHYYNDKHVRMKY